MDAMLTLYILGGGVALAALIFIVMSIVSAFRAPRLPDLTTLQSQPLPQTFARALTPLPAPAAMISLSPTPESQRQPRDRTPPRTVIALPALLGIAPATRAKSEPAFAGSSMSPSSMSPSAMSPGAMSPGAMTTSAPPPIAPRPIAMTPSAPAPMSGRVPVPLPTLVAPPELPARMPRATTPRPITAVSTRVSWNEEEWRRSAPLADQAMPHAKPLATSQAKPLAKPQTRATLAAQNNESTQRIIRSEPIEEPSLLRTVIGWTIATVLLAASPIIAAPSLLDSLCDHDWYGADATRLAREAARDANAAIDLPKL